MVKLHHQLSVNFLSGYLSSSHLQDNRPPTSRIFISIKNISKEPSGVHSEFHPPDGQCGDTRMEESEDKVMILGAYSQSSVV